MSYRGLESSTSDTYTRTHALTSGRQLKITFFDILSDSEYPNTDIAIFFSWKHSFLSKEAKLEKNCLQFNWAGEIFKHRIKTVKKIDICCWKSKTSASKKYILLKKYIDTHFRLGYIRLIFTIPETLHKLLNSYFFILILHSNACSKSCHYTVLSGTNILLNTAM